MFTKNVFSQFLFCFYIKANICNICHHLRLNSFKENSLIMHCRNQYRFFRSFNSRKKCSRLSHIYRNKHLILILIITYKFTHIRRIKRITQKRVQFCLMFTSPYRKYISQIFQNSDTKQKAPPLSRSFFFFRIQLMLFRINRGSFETANQHTINILFTFRKFIHSSVIITNAGCKNLNIIIIN